MAEHIVVAAARLGLGNRLLGGLLYEAETIIKERRLPPRVFPLVGLVMGYPAENPPPRPRYPLDFTLFEDEYPEFSDDQIDEAIKVMDEGYLAQDYYREANFRITLEGDRQETFTFHDYSWTEHISRKVGQWIPSLDEIVEPLARYGFNVTPD